MLGAQAPAARPACLCACLRPSHAAAHSTWIRVSSVCLHHLGPIEHSWAAHLQAVPLFSPALAPRPNLPSLNPQKTISRVAQVARPLKRSNNNTEGANISAPRRREAGRGPQAGPEAALSPSHEDKASRSCAREPAVASMAGTSLHPRQKDQFLRERARLHHLRHRRHGMPVCPLASQLASCRARP